VTSGDDGGLRCSSSDADVMWAPVILQMVQIVLVNIFCGLNLNCIDEIQYLEKVFFGLDVFEAVFFVVGSSACGNQSDVINSVVIWLLVLGIYFSLNILFKRIQGFSGSNDIASKNRYRV